MTAFNEVITAEAEAEQAIAHAKEEVVAATAAARTANTQYIATEVEKLQNAEVEAIKTKEAAVAVLVKKIEADSLAAVTAVRQGFASKHAELKRFLLEQF